MIFSQNKSGVDETTLVDRSEEKFEPLTFPVLSTIHSLLTDFSGTSPVFVLSYQFDCIVDTTGTPAIATSVRLPLVDFV